MAHSLKNDIEVLTYNKAIFRLGAFLHIEPVEADIANLAIALLDNPEMASPSLTMLRMRTQGSTEFVDVTR